VRTLLALLIGAPLALAAMILGSGALATLLIAQRAAWEFPSQGPFIPVEGGRLVAIEAGDPTPGRPAVILVHGAVGNGADLMESLGRPLAARGFHVLALDRPGLGWSDRPGGSSDAAPEAQARLIAQALAARGLGPAIVLGHSWGGALALALALDHPERVAGLALVSPVARPFERMPEIAWYWRLALKPPVTWLLSRTLGPPAGLYHLERGARAAFAPQPVAEDYLRRARSALALRPGAMLANVQDLAGLPAALERMAPRTPSLAVPTVIVGGEADAVVPFDRQGRALAQTIPGARLVPLPGVGHMAPWVATDRLVAEIEALAGRLPAR